MRRSAGLAASLFLSALSLAGCGHGTVIGSATPTPAPTPPPKVTNEFAIPTAGSQPGGITLGTDGFLYFAEQTSGKLGRVSTGGTFTENVIDALGGTTGNNPVDATTGPDGNIWFTEKGPAPGVARFAADKVTEYHVAGSAPTYIAPGPASNTVVFSDPGLNMIDTVNVSTGVVTEAAIPTASANPMGLAFNSSNSNVLFFVEHDASKIGMLNVSTNSVTEIPTLTANAGPTDIVQGPDGAMWFTENSVAKIGRITLTGQMQEFPLAPATSATALVSASDNNLYFLDPAHNEIGSISGTAPGVVTEYAIPTANALTVPPAFPGKIIFNTLDGHLYFTETAANKIGQFTI